jgi:hypothetical protein
LEKVSYKGWPNCYRLASDTTELIVTGDVGPRIIRFGFLREENEFAEFAQDLGKTGGTEFRMYGGHRLWCAPESVDYSYYGDNHPLKVFEEKGALRVVQPPEPLTGIQKEMTISLEGSNQARVKHVLRNTGASTVEFAPWPITMMAPGGVGIIPQPTPDDPEGLLPNRVLVLWPYTDMADPRIQWGSKYIRLQQDPSAQTAFKLGLSADDGWVAYLRNDHLCVKLFELVEGATYPDFGCSVEMYTKDRFLEMETLGPLQQLPPGSAAEHVERWFLFRGVGAGAGKMSIDEESIERLVLPLVAEARKLSTL